jgi:hypothetical protein
MPMRLKRHRHFRVAHSTIVCTRRAFARCAFAALLLAVKGQKMHRLYFHAAAARLRFLGTANDV